jgi:hypothetical protein
MGFTVDVAKRVEDLVDPQLAAGVDRLVHRGGIPFSSRATIRNAGPDGVTHGQIGRGRPGPARV